MIEGLNSFYFYKQVTMRRNATIVSKGN